MFKEKQFCEVGRCNWVYFQCIVIISCLIKSEPKDFSGIVTENSSVANDISSNTLSQEFQVYRDYNIVK